MPPEQKSNVTSLDEYRQRKNQKIRPETGQATQDTDSKPTISLPEGLIMTMIVLAADSIEVAATLVTGVPVIGVVAAFVLIFESLIVLAIIQLWLIMKGIRSLWFLSGSLIDFLPVIGMFPTKTATLLVLITMVNLEARIPILKTAVDAATRPISAAEKIAA